MRVLCALAIAVGLIGTADTAQADRGKPSWFSSGFSIGMMSLGDADDRTYAAFATRVFAGLRVADAFVVRAEAVLGWGNNSNYPDDNLSVRVWRPSVGVRWDASRIRVDNDLYFGLATELGLGSNTETWEDGGRRQRPDVHFGIVGRFELGLSKRLLAVELEFRGLVARHRALHYDGKLPAMETPGKPRHLNDLGFMFLMTLASR